MGVYTPLCVYTPVCVCNVHLHACEPLNAVDLPGASGHVSLHKSPTYSHCQGKGAQRRASHSSGTNSSGYFQAQAAGEKRKQILQEPNSTIPTRPKLRPLSRATKSHWRRKCFEILIFPRPSSNSLSLPPSTCTDKFFLKSKVHSACCSCGQTGGH